MSEAEKEPTGSSTNPVGSDSNGAAERLDADGRERPPFLLNFPKDPKLDLLVQAYEAGNFRYVRSHAAQLIAETDNPEVRKAAEQLRRRIDPHPLVVTMLAIAIVLFSFLVVWAYTAASHD